MHSDSYKAVIFLESIVDLNQLGFSTDSNEIKKKEPSNFEKEMLKMVNETKKCKIPDAPFIPTNPINETNKEIGDLHSTIKSESSKNSRSASKWNLGMLLISLIALITSAVFSILSFSSSNESSVRLEKLISEQNRLLKANFGLNNNLVKKELEMNKPINKPINKSIKKQAVAEVKI